MGIVNKLLLVMVIIFITNSETIVTTLNPPTSTISPVSQKISIRLQSPPIYAYPGIITDFLVTPVLERSQDDIENMFTYEFSDNKFLPPRMLISLGERNDQIRVMFDYQNDIPIKPFTVRFRVTDRKNTVLGTSSISIVYDSLTGGITSALHLGGQNEDFIR